MRELFGFEFKSNNAKCAIIQRSTYRYYCEKHDDLLVINSYNRYLNFSQFEPDVWADYLFEHRKCPKLKAKVDKIIASLIPEEKRSYLRRKRDLAYKRVCFEKAHESLNRILKIMGSK